MSQSKKSYLLLFVAFFLIIRGVSRIYTEKLTYVGIAMVVIGLLGVTNHFWNARKITKSSDQN